MSATVHNLIIVGFGGHGRSAADVAVAMGVTRLIFLEPAARPGETFDGYDVVAKLPELEFQWHGYAASGSGRIRAQQLNDLAVPIATLIAPSATFGPGAKVGLGGFVGHHAHVGPLAELGRGVIANTSSVIEHDCRIGDFCHVSVNATIAGRSKLGANVMIGAGAVVIDGITICNDVVVGAGAVVVTDIAEPGTYAGVPAKRL